MEFDNDVLRQLLIDEEAITFAEYGLLLVLIALLVVLSEVLVGVGISELFQRTGKAFEVAMVRAIL